MTKKLIPYINRFNGDVKVVSKQNAKKLNEDYTKVQFTENEKGQRVMRFELEGATVDVLENEQPVKLEAQDVNRNSK